MLGVAGLFSDDVRLIPLDFRVCPVINNAMVVMESVSASLAHLGHEAWVEFVRNEGTIKRCDTLKVNCVSFDYIVETE